ncbi:hypothetical protein TURU_100941 [Turdus rufiventris]|nr:hypothetical protein TURU_100941 [Turdus rufiventris]
MCPSGTSVSQHRYQCVPAILVCPSIGTSVSQRYQRVPTYPSTGTVSEDLTDAESNSSVISRASTRADRTLPSRTSRYSQESGLSDNSPISDAAEEPHKKQRQRTQFTDNL